jgi:hypothetical protein
MKHLCGARRLDSAKESGVNSWTVYNLHQQPLGIFKRHSDILILYSLGFYLLVAITSCTLSLIGYILSTFWLSNCGYLALHVFHLN